MKICIALAGYETRFHSWYRLLPVNRQIRNFWLRVLIKGAAGCLVSGQSGNETRLIDLAMRHYYAWPLLLLAVCCSATPKLGEKRAMHCHSFPSLKFLPPSPSYNPHTTVPFNKEYLSNVVTRVYHFWLIILQTLISLIQPVSLCLAYHPVRALLCSSTLHIPSWSSVQE